MCVCVCVCVICIFVCLCVSVCVYACAALVKKNRLAENGRSHGSSEIRSLTKAL